MRCSRRTCKRDESPLLLYRSIVNPKDPKRNNRCLSGVVLQRGCWVSQPSPQTDLKHIARISNNRRNEEAEPRVRGYNFHSPSNFIFNPISVRAETNSAVSWLLTCPPSFRSMFNPSVQSAHRLWSGAMRSASEPS